jgi:hypothetical protein
MILLLMLKPEKTGRIKRIIMLMVLLLLRWPAIPLVSKVQISFGISGSLQIAMRSGHAQALCPPQFFLCQKLTVLPLPLSLPSRPVGLDFIVSRYMRS